VRHRQSATKTRNLRKTLSVFALVALSGTLNMPPLPLSPHPGTLVFPWIMARWEDVLEFQEEEKGRAVELRYRKRGGQIAQRLPILPRITQSRAFQRGGDATTGPRSCHRHRRRRRTRATVYCTGSRGEAPKMWPPSLDGEGWGRVTRATVYCTGSRGRSPKMWPPSLNGEVWGIFTRATTRAINCTFPCIFAHFKGI